MNEDAWEQYERAQEVWFWKSHRAEAERQAAEEQSYRRYKPTPPRESARRRALFTKAESVLAVAAAMHGITSPLIAVCAWHLRSGLRGGLYMDYDKGNKRLWWSPREGYQVIEIDEIPF